MTQSRTCVMSKCSKVWDLDWSTLFGNWPLLPHATKVKDELQKTRKKWIHAMRIGLVTSSKLLPISVWLLFVYVGFI